MRNQIYKGICVKNAIEAVTSCYVGSGNNILNNSTTNESEKYYCGGSDVPFCQVLKSNLFFYSIFFQKK